MLTKFGEYMRILRVKKRIVMKDTADALGVTTPFLSAVENGKKKIPDGWFEKIAKIYHLADDEKKDLMIAIEQSMSKLTINLEDCNENQKELVFQFQRSFSNIDEETTRQIIEILNRKEGKNGL